jgi:hypothetical protein
MALDQPQQGEDDEHWHQQTTIKKHWNGCAPSVLEDGSGVAGRRQKKVERCGHNDSLTWQRRGDDGAGSASARRGRSASTLINNNQQVKQSRVVDTRSDVSLPPQAAELLGATPNPPVLSSPLKGEGLSTPPPPPIVMNLFTAENAKE